jgi:hypothetical protein
MVYSGFQHEGNLYSKGKSRMEREELLSRRKIIQNRLAELELNVTLKIGKVGNNKIYAVLDNGCDVLGNLDNDRSWQAMENVQMLNKVMKSEGFAGMPVQKHYPYDYMCHVHAYGLNGSR